jgi:serine protease AprX
VGGGMKKIAIILALFSFCLGAVGVFLAGAAAGSTTVSGFDTSDDGRVKSSFDLLGDATNVSGTRVGAFAGLLTSPTRSKISSALQTRLSDGAETTFLVLLTEQADLSHVAALPTKEAKGRAVYETLRRVAQRTQAPLSADLKAFGVAYRPFYIVNMLLVRGDAALAQALAARSDVARLEANPAVRAIPPEPFENQAYVPSGTAAIEWGVRNIRADEVWALGYLGQGVVVAGQDTGYDWDHPALKSHYRGWDGVSVDHDYNWHDAIHVNDPHTWPGNPCGFDSPEPCDDHGHGTHTMGTIVGDDGGSNQIGVAPGSRWISCRNMEQGWGTPATYAECFEFFLAPYPIGGDPMTQGDPGRAPHVINNSWSCPPSEGCDIDSLRDVVENVRAAGIVVVVSAGNSGSACATVNEPPALYDASFSIGATDSGDRIAGFSSRGPVTIDDSHRPKPDVSAPGVGVRSSFPGGTYGSLSGTSMAAPHVTGLIALLWSAAPQWIGNVDATERLVRETARPVIDLSCGGDVDGHPNNVYGWGIVDAMAAVRATSFKLEVSAKVEPVWAFAGTILTYTFTVSNTATLSQTTDVILSDTLPISTSFARASGIYSRTGGEITWRLGAVSPRQQTSVTLAVMVDRDVSSGTSIVNWDYAVRSSQVLTPARGSPAVALVPWQLFVPVFRSWP